MSKHSNDDGLIHLPKEGLSRWEQLRRFIPLSKETWRQLGKAGKAPQPIRPTQRCTMYQNAEVHRWLSDPVNFQTYGGNDIENTNVSDT